MKNTKKFLWVYLLAMIAMVSGCTEEVEPSNIRSDQDFVDYAVQSSIFKAQTSRLATQVAASNDIKAIAKELFGYYNTANDELSMKGKENGFMVPVSLNDKQQQLYNELDRLWGQDFDRRLLAEMRRVYQEDIKWYEEAASKLKNNAMKSWASKSLQELRIQQGEIQQMASLRGL
jgi:predicted outer membrane protein